MDAGVPERFDRVDVPYPGNNPLIEQRLLDGNATTPKLRAQRVAIEPRVGRVRAKIGDGRLSRGNDVQGSEGAAILEHDARSVIEVHMCARESRQAVGGTSDHLIAIESKVSDEVRSAVQPDQLILADAADGVDAPADDASPHRRRQAPLERRMMGFESDDPLAERGRGQAARRLLDLRKLRHCFSCSACAPSPP